MQPLKGFAPCLWFDSQAQEAAEFYCAIFPNSKITPPSHYGNEGQEIHGRKAGSVATVTFELSGHKIIALNGGPMFKFNEAISFQVTCDDQAEVDHYWNGLIAGTGSESRCGWLKDKYGVSWQIVPNRMIEIMTGADRDAANRATAAMMTMRKIDIAAIEEAAKG